MQHIAILNKSWGFNKKILSGEKTIESRWYVNKSRPWDIIHAGDIVYFKNSGEPVTVRATVQEVLQFSSLNAMKVKEILETHGKEIGVDKENYSYFFNRFKTKSYCILIFLDNPKSITPFDINKKGYGMMSAWICVKSIEVIKR